MNDNKRNIFKGTLKYIIVAIFSISFYMFLKNISEYGHILTYIYNISKPIVIAFMMAFVLNILVTKIERYLFEKFLYKNKFLYRKKRAISILMSVIILLTFIITILALLIPQLISSIKTLTEELPVYANDVSENIKNMLLSLQLKEQMFQTISSIWNDIISQTTNYMSNLFSKLIPQIFSLFSSLASYILVFLLSFILSIYMLIHKEKLLHNLKRVLAITLKKDTFDYIIHVGGNFNKTFTSFISGQIIEAIILGVLSYIGMTIFNFPYPLLIATILGVTCLIPYFGAFIGTIPAFIIVFISDSSAGLWFLIFAICLQQLEGNLIYPKVVGSSVGLPTIWVSIALILGGNMFGFIGIVLSVPTFAGIYFLFREFIYKKENEKRDNGLYYLEDIKTKQDK